jgi:site-specific DNA recombinase
VDGRSDPDGLRRSRQLIINETEATAVRRVFELYLDEGNVPALLERLVRERIKTPERVSTKGKRSGGLWFTRGHVYKLLSNPLYIGQIAHKGIAHPGQHVAIVDRKVWDAVQKRLAKNTQGERTRRRRADPSAPLLAGLLCSGAGNPVIPMHSVKAGRRYDYYVEQLPAVSDTSKPLAHPAIGLTIMPHGQNRQAILRLPAAEIDRAVTVAVKDLLLDQRRLLSQLGDLSATEVATVAAVAPGLLTQELEASMTAIVRKATISANLLRIELNIAGLRQLLGLPVAERADVVGGLDVPLSYCKRGVQLKMTVSGSASETVRTVDPTLATAIARAFDWFERLSQGRARSIDELAAKDGFDPAYISHVMTLAFHSPREITRILEGKQKRELTGKQLIWNETVPVLWDDGRLAPPTRAVLA